MNKKNIIIVTIIIVIVGASSFYGGALYGKKSVVSKRASVRDSNKQFARGNKQFAGTKSTSSNGRFINGQITAKDNSSITIKMSNDSSKIIFLSGSTPIGKTVNGSSSDLSIGQNVIVNGTANPDGSIVAQNIQIRSNRHSGN